MASTNPYASKLSGTPGLEIQRAAITPAAMASPARLFALEIKLSPQRRGQSDRGDLLDAVVIALAGVGRETELAGEDPLAHLQPAGHAFVGRLHHAVAVEVVPAVEHQLVD